MEGGNSDSITGTISDVNDVDVFQISVDGDEIFFASTVNGANFDTELFLFDSDGLFISGNDDANGTFQSTLDLSLSTGTYFLAISSFSNSPVGSLQDGFTNTGQASGNYTISLNGVQAPSFSLGATTINDVTGTGISFNNDLIAFVQEVTISDFSSGFILSKKGISGVRSQIVLKLQQR